MKFFLIVLVTFISLIIALPSQFNLLGKEIHKINILNRNDLVYGLDLVGGSRLTFEADTSNFTSEEEKKEALNSLKSVMERRVNFFGVSEPNILISNFEGKDRVVVELPGVKDTAEAINIVGQTASLNFGIIDTSDENNPILLSTDLTGADLKKAEVSFDQVASNPVVLLTFTQEGSEKFQKITKENIGKQVPILLDNEVVSAPVVQGEITGGTAQITGDFSLDEAKNLVTQLNAGALPVSVNLISERTIGASLGEEAVSKSIKAGIFGLLGVFIFMIILYGKLGLIADIGLIVFGVITIAVYKLVPIVLTLPGIAGFLLSIGMAVDANILIFERFREEKQKGTSDAYGLEVAFGRAWDSIRDANIATLFTAFVLSNPLNWPFLHVSGPVKGFAITLALGILIGLFTGVFVSRNLLRLIIKK